MSLKDTKFNSGKKYVIAVTMISGALNFIFPIKHFIPSFMELIISLFRKTKGKI